MSARESLFSFLYRWLIESDLPWGLQVTWKLLTLGMAALIAVEVLPNVTDPFGFVLLTVLAVAVALVGLFTKLGDG